MRRIVLLVSVAMLVGVIALPASATKPDPASGLEDGHKIWICHATRSLENPYVKIEIDIAAWDVEDPDNNDHGPIHHAREKDGVEWADYALEDPDAECELPDEPPDLVCPINEEPADYVIYFDGSKLTKSDPTQMATGLDIDQGTYDVTLVSSDTGMRRVQQQQDNEQWRLAIGGDTSDWSDDLPDDSTSVGPEESEGGTITITDAKTATAQHWSSVNPSDNQDSVIPEYACLVEASDI